MDSDHEGLMTRPGPIARVGRVLAERLAELEEAAAAEESPPALVEPP
ncbi:hypothetical protein HFP43_19425 [Streptomyces sp. SJ1-7]|nr:hypothetical protein [Streptomyces sp. SJ1-7]